MRTSFVLTSLGAVALVAAGCGGTSATGSAPTAASPTISTSCPLTVTDAWVKAVDSGMTGAFGVVANPTDSDVAVTAAATTLATSTELHQTTDEGGTMTMRQTAEFLVPANGTLQLAPGGDHIMLMGVTAPIEAGQDVRFTLTCSGGGEASFSAQARPFSGANESYQPGGMGGQ